MMDSPGTDPTDAASKRKAINRACQESDIPSLVSLADSEGGLLDDALRATAWPLLLGYSGQDVEPLSSQKWQDLPAHHDEEQVQKDADRAFVYYPANETQESMQSRKTTLYNLIVKVLRVNSMLHYFQGYHDIAQVFLLVLGEQTAFTAVSRVSLLRIRDYMLSSLGPSTRHLQLIPAILKCTDPVLAQHLSETPPYFALSSVLTLYAHEIQRYADIARLYDFILAHEPVMTVYLFVALIVYRRTELLEIEDQDMLLFILSKLPQPLDLQALVDKSLEIFKAHPPETLPGRAWRDISSSSVLKTSRHNLQTQTLDQARALFRLQSQQLTREELAARVMKRVNKNRRSIISFGATVLVGVLSYYLRKSGNDRVLWTTFWHVAQVFRS